MCQHLKHNHTNKGTTSKIIKINAALRSWATQNTRLQQRPGDHVKSVVL
jgi:hypothetical protein